MRRGMRKHEMNLESDRFKLNYTPTGKKSIKKLCDETRLDFKSVKVTASVHGLCDEGFFVTPAQEKRLVEMFENMKKASRDEIHRENLFQLVTCPKCEYRNELDIEPKTKNTVAVWRICDRCGVKINITKRLK